VTQAGSLARLRLARTEGVGPQTFRRLLARHGGAESALDALAAERLVAADLDRTRRGA
jgi:DNA processing protein